MRIRFLIIVVAVIIAFLSCERDVFITDPDASIRFSVDTLYFDTVFTELSTVTKNFTIHNPQKDFIKISRIRLAKGENSVYRINLDGIPGTEFHNIEIPPKDSIYVFVEATLDPNDQDGLLLQQDSIVTETNGNIQDIDIVAWGQDVHMIEGILSTQTWINDKPYLIIDFAIVDSLEVLTIDPGVRVYLHRDAVFAVGGTLIANGEKDMPVTFGGDRLEKMYEDIPGQWGGIYFFAGTRDNKLNYTEVRGGNFGMIVDTSMNENPTLEITNSTIAHMSSVGLLARGAKIKGINNLIYNCGSSALALTLGGSYEFYHCTIANRWGLFSPPRTDPSLYLSNYYFYNDTLENGEVVQKPEIRDIEKANFINCIIWGSRNNELIIDQYPAGGSLNYYFENCLGKFNQEEFPLTEDEFPALINNKSPEFVSWEDYDFQLDTLSPAKDAGVQLSGEEFRFDLNGQDRTVDAKPDIGAYERIED